MENPNDTNSQPGALTPSNNSGGRSAYQPIPTINPPFAGIGPGDFTTVPMNGGNSVLSEGKK